MSRKWKTTENHKGTLGKHWKVKDTSKMSESLRKRWKDPVYRKNQCESQKGHIVTEKTRKSFRLLWQNLVHREHMIKAHKGQKSWNKGKRCPQLAGKNNGSWKNGVSFEPYSPEFNKYLKEQIRKRDNFVCQECGYTEKQLGRKLDIHHIDYNKKNNNSDNLISLCRSCHAKTSFNRENWIGYYRNKLLDQI